MGTQQVREGRAAVRGGVAGWALKVTACALASAGTALPARGAITFDPLYASDYSGFSLGSAPGVPANYGGLVFKAGDPNTILLGGAANGASGAIYAVQVVRDPTTHHVTGFTGTATLVSAATGASFGGIDGGLTYAPNGTLMYTSYSDNSIGQIKPGSTAPDKKVALSPLGFASSVGSLLFTPAGFGANAGHLKVLSYNASIWSDATVSDDGSGTYNITPGSTSVTLGGGLEGAIYVAAGNKLFNANSVLVSQYGAGKIVAYTVDANGDPVFASAHDFITGLSGAEGAAIDPVTGDFFFSTFGGSNQIVEVNGFLAPEPAGALAAVGAAACAMRRRRRAHAAH